MAKMYVAKNGIVFKSMKAVAEKLNVPYMKLREYLIKTPAEDVERTLGLREMYVNKSEEAAARKAAASELKKVAKKLEARASRRRVPDPFGNTYDSVTDMCAAWNVKLATYHAALRAGKSQEEALCGQYKDQYGNHFRTLRAVAEYHGVPVDKLSQALNEGWELIDILNDTNRRMLTDTAYTCRDHEGRKFRSEKDMAHFWGIGYEAYKRRRYYMKWSLRDTLTRKVVVHNTAKIVYDHKGKKFESQGALCRAYGINVTTYKNRLRSGWTLEEALTVKAAPSGNNSNRVK